MKAKITRMEKVMTDVRLPAGVYVGEWSGYQITLFVGLDEQEWRLMADVGIRGHCHCQVTVGTDGSATVEAL